MNWLKKGIMPLKPLLGFIKDKMLTPGCFLNIDETWGWVRIKFVGDGTTVDTRQSEFVALPLLGACAQQICDGGRSRQGRGCCLV